MVKIENEHIIDALDKVILEYNNQFWDPKDADKYVDLYDEEVGISEETLQKLPNFSMALNITRMQPEEIQDCMDAVKGLLDITNFSYFSLNIMQRGAKDPTAVDLSFLEKLSPNIKNIQLRNIDLSSLDAEGLKGFEDLEYLTLYHCNISSPEIVEPINDKCFIDLSQNPIDKEHLPEMIELLNRHKGRVTVSDAFKEIAEIIQKKEIKLSKYTEFESQIDLASIEGLKIVLDDGFDLESVDVKDIMQRVDGLENAVLISNAERYSKLHGQTETTLPAEISIKNASELSFEDLKRFESVRTVTIKDGLNTEGKPGEPYTREEFLAARKRIDEIIQDVPQSGTGVSDKVIFAEVCKRLAQQMKYDDYAISKEGKQDKKLETTCRNLYGGLVEGQCVCAGYADILRNTLACVGIESNYISGNENSLEVGGTYKLNTDDINAHAWNRVNLDGQWFNTDLTWNRNNIVAGRPPIYFLKADKDFGHEEYRTVRGIESKCDRTISQADTVKLFDGQDIDIAPREETQSARPSKSTSITYLGTAVREAASTGLVASNIRKASNSISIEKTNDIEEKDRVE